MPRGPAANWNRHQYKKAAMLAYTTAASAGSRGNVGKLRPAGRGESDQRAGAETGFSGFRLISITCQAGMILLPTTGFKPLARLGESIPARDSIFKCGRFRCVSAP